VRSIPETSVPRARSSPKATDKRSVCETCGGECSLKWVEAQHQGRAEEAASEADERQQTDMHGGYQIISAEPTSTCEHCGGSGFVSRRPG
jgi:hypothetical protein